MIDDKDEGFRTPNKPVGPFLSEEQAKRQRELLGWTVAEDAQKRGWRRVVPSPAPLKVIQRHMIRDAVRAGHLVIACGGGGIPIREDEHGRFVGVEAVVDKDLTSAVLGAEIGAELLIILTAVPNVYVGFGTPHQRALGAVTLEEIERLRADGQFPPGSMGPKIDAVIHFLRHGGKRALITDPESLPRAIEGRAGTHFIGRV